MRLSMNYSVSLILNWSLIAFSGADAATSEMYYWMTFVCRAFPKKSRRCFDPSESLRWVEETSRLCVTANWASAFDLISGSPIRLNMQLASVAY